MAAVKTAWSRRPHSPWTQVSSFHLLESPPSSSTKLSNFVFSVFSPSSSSCSSPFFVRYIRPQFLSDSVDSVKSFAPIPFSHCQIPRLSSSSSFPSSSRFPFPQIFSSVFGRVFSCSTSPFCAPVVVCFLLLLLISSSSSCFLFSGHCWFVVSCCCCCFFFLRSCF